MMSEYSQKGLPMAKEDCEATTQQPTSEKPGTTIPKSDPLDKRPKGDFDALGILILQRKPRKRGRLQYSIRTLLILMLLVQVSLAIFIWLRPDRAKMAYDISDYWFVLATHVGLLLLSAVIIVLQTRQKPDIAFLIFSGLLAFVLFLTLFVCFTLDTDVWKFLPSIWLFVLGGGGLGLGISMQEHPD